MQRTSTINQPAGADVAWTGPAQRAVDAPHARLAWRRRVARLTRWLHIYGSMASLALVLFFSITGITLNHQEWFQGHGETVDRQGEMDPSWLRTTDADGVDELRVVEHLRTVEGMKGALADVRIEETHVEVAFKGPAYAASVLVDRGTGRFDLTESRMGLAALVNDLHKGRDTGPAWRAVIDLSAVLLVFICLTGLVLLYFVHKHRLAGVMLLGAGTLVSYLVYLVWVP